MTVCQKSGTNRFQVFQYVIEVVKIKVKKNVLLNYYFQSKKPQKDSNDY